MLAALVPLALAACSSDPIAPPIRSTAIVGTYALTRVNAHGLPMDLSARIVTGGSLTLDADGTYTREQRDSTVTASGGWERVQSQDHGTWTSRGDSLFLVTSFALYGYGPGVGTMTSAGVTLSTRNARAVTTGGSDAVATLEFAR